MTSSIWFSYVFENYSSFSPPERIFIVFIRIVLIGYSMKKKNKIRKVYEKK